MPVPATDSTGKPEVKTPAQETADKLDEAGKSRREEGLNGVTGSNDKLSKEEADKLYEEGMEDEYAKREGGA